MERTHSLPVTKVHARIEKELNNMKIVALFLSLAVAGHIANGCRHQRQGAVQGVAG